MDSVTNLIDRFKQGYSSAFGHLLGRFFAYPVKLARRRLGRGNPLPLDGEDVAQMVFLELYNGVKQKRPLADGLSDTGSLLKTLATLTRQQVRRQWRDHTRKCRDVRQTARATDLGGNRDADPMDALLHQAGVRWLRDVESRETIEQLLALLPSGRYRAVVQLLYQGQTVANIAGELNRSVRAVQRYLVEIKGIWESHPEGRAILWRCLPGRSEEESAPPEK